MVTKTLTIMEDAYKLLLDNKLEEESFSQEIRRILTDRGKKSLRDYFGILNKKTGEALMKSYEKTRREQMKLTRKRIAR